MVAKRFRLGLSLRPFQLCRSEKSPCEPKKRTLASYLNSPIVVPISQDNSYDCNSTTKPKPEATGYEECRNKRILCNSPVYDISDSNISLVRLPKRGKETKEHASIWFSSDLSSRSFGSSYDFGYSLETIRELDPIDDGGTEEESSFEESKSFVSEDNDKVKDSFTVVKRSENPYEDFKKSMLEMITEKEMYGVKDLEQLLQSFLVLNSARYHGAIIEAFAEIWGGLFGVDTNSTHV